MNRSDEDLADAILRGLPPTEECRRLSRSEAMVVVRSVYHKVPVRLPNVRPFVVGQMLALCMHLMGSRPPARPPVCKFFQMNVCTAGPCCKFDHLGLPDERELYHAMRWTRP